MKKKEPYRLPPLGAPNPQDGDTIGIFFDVVIARVAEKFCEDDALKAGCIRLVQADGEVLTHGTAGSYPTVQGPDLLARAERATTALLKNPDVQLSPFVSEGGAVRCPVNGYILAFTSNWKPVVCAAMCLAIAYFRNWVTAEQFTALVDHQLDPQDRKTFVDVYGFVRDIFDGFKAESATAS